MRLTALALLALAGGLVPGCERGPVRSETEKNAEKLAAIIVGTWLPPELDGETMTIEAGGRWTAGQSGGPQSSGTWKIDGGDLVVTWDKMRGERVSAADPPHRYAIVSVEKDSFVAKTTEGDPAEWKKVGGR